MFGKLLKYEFHYLIRIFGPMWALVLGMSLLSRIFFPKDADRFLEMVANDSTAAGAFNVLLTVTFMALIAMMAVMAVVLIQRFYKGMFGDEGYLMFTLPVSSGQLINAKMLGALVMNVGTSIVFMLSLGILLFYSDLWEMLGGELYFVWQELAAEQLGIALSIFWLVITALAATIANLYMVYLAMALGQLWRKHPVAGAILAFYGMTIVLSILGSIAVAMFGNTLPELFLTMEDTNPTMLMTMSSLVQIAESVVLSVVCFAGTKWMLDKKLNIA